MSVVGIDLGGTKIKVMLEESGGRRIDWICPTGGHERPTDVLLRCVEAVHELLAQSQEKLQACAIGLPGQVDRNAGTFLRSPAILPTWRDVPVQSLLEEALGVPVCIDNDVNFALHGERLEGAALAARDVLMLTFGTGVGAALVVGGVAQQGAFGGAGELGHLQVGACLPDSPFAKTTRLGEVASVSGLQKLNAYYGDGHQAQALATCGKAIALAIEAASCIIDPGMVVLGGGLADAMGDALLESVQRSLQRTFPLGIKSLRLELARCGNQAGVMGAVATAWTRVPRPALLSAHVQQVEAMPKHLQQAHEGNGALEFCRPFDSDDLDSALQFVDYVEIPPGVSIGTHRHGADEEIYFIHRGRGQMTLEGESFAVSTGDLIRNPPGGEHGLLAVGGAPLAVLVFDAAVSEERSWLRNDLERRWQELGCTPMKDAAEGHTLAENETAMAQILRKEAGQ
ncbi:MAG: ROK family protein [Planctomycetota bacterium]